MPYLSDDALAASVAANAAVPMASRSGMMFHGAIMDASVVRETRVQACDAFPLSVHAPLCPCSVAHSSPNDDRWSRCYIT